MSRSQSFHLHLLGIALMVLVGILWSFNGVLTRLISPELTASHPMALVGFRSTFAALSITLCVLFFQKRPFCRDFIASGLPGAVHALFWGLMQICFLLALVFTSSANTFLIAGLGPMVSAFLARIVLKTKIPAYTYAALILAWGGVLWMGTNGGGLQGTSLSNRELFGIFLVCVSTFCSGANFVVVQGWGGGKNLLPAAAVGSLGAGLVGLIASGAACDSLQDFGLLFVMGFVLTGVPCILIIFAGRYLLAPESALIGRVETVLGPIWPWIFVGEVPTNASLVGGAMILTALFANEGANIYREYHKPS